MILGRLADRLILCPTRDKIAAESRRRLLDFQGGTLEVWTQRAGGDRGVDPKLFVLKFVGTGGRAERATAHPLEFWSDLPAESWAVNPPGYGGSTGRSSVRIMPAMAQRAFDEIAQRAAGRPILVTGNSLGCTSALYVAAHNPNVAGVLLRNPPPLRQLIVGRFGWWNLTLGARLIAWQVPRELCTLDNAQRCRMPAMFVMSGRDRVVPPAYQRQVIERYAGEKRVLVLPAADHASAVLEDELPEFEKTLRWLRGKLLSRPALA